MFNMDTSTTNYKEVYIKVYKMRGRLGMLFILKREIVKENNELHS
jgi:hypothetical protein